MLSQVEQQNIFNALYMKQAVNKGDSVYIRYIDGMDTMKPLSQLSDWEKTRVLSVNSEQTGYSIEFGPTFQTFAFLGDGSKVPANQISDLQSSLSGEKYRKILIDNFQLKANFEQPQSGSTWLATNFKNYVSAMNEINDFWNRVQRKPALPVAFGEIAQPVAVYPTEDFLNKKLWSKVTPQQKNELLAEALRQYQLRSKDNGFFAPITSNVQDLFSNANNFVERNSEEIAVVIAVALTGGVAAAGGFGATAATATNSLVSTVSSAIPTITAPSAALPTATQVGQAAGSFLVAEGTKQAQNFLNQQTAAKQPEQTAKPVESVTQPKAQETKDNSGLLVVLAFGFLAFAIGA